MCLRLFAIILLRQGSKTGLLDLRADECYVDPADIVAHVQSPRSQISSDPPPDPTDQ